MKNSVLCRQTQTRPSNYFQLPIFKRRWKRDQFHRANRWRTYSCGHCMGILAPKRCPLIRISTVLTDTWPPKYTSSRIRVDVATRFILAYRAISLSSVGVVLWDVPDRRGSPIIPVAGKRYTRRPITAWCTTIYHATLIFINHARDMLTGCHLSAKVIFYLTIIEQWKHSIYGKSPTTTCKHTLCNYVWHQL